MLLSKCFRKSSFEMNKITSLRTFYNNVKEGMNSSTSRDGPTIFREVVLSTIFVNNKTASRILFSKWLLFYHNFTNSKRRTPTATNKILPLCLTAKFIIYDENSDDLKKVYIIDNHLKEVWFYEPYTV